MKLEKLMKTGGIKPQNYGSKELVKLWPGFVGWEKRLETEGPFLLDVLKEEGTRVLDLSLGIGPESIFLIKNGYKVTSNEIDPLFRKAARKNAKNNGVKLDIRKDDWRELSEKIRQGEFDAALMLGNSLTYLFREKDRQRAIEGIAHALRPGGIAIIDERNYPYILENRDEILKNGGFRYSGKFVYCGGNVHGSPVEIHDNLVVMEYRRQDGKGKPAYLQMYPFKAGELYCALSRVFARIIPYSDFSAGFSHEADFFQYVCIKKER